MKIAPQLVFCSIMLSCATIIADEPKPTPPISTRFVPPAAKDSDGALAEANQEEVERKPTPRFPTDFPPPVAKEPVGVFAEAKQLQEQVERMGEQLIAIVEDESEPDLLRLEAANQLGNLRYLPAIDVLIKHVDLMFFHFVFNAPDVLNADPISTSLGKYRTAAVPQLVEAYASERNMQRQLGIVSSIRSGGSTRVALQYIEGMMSALKDDDGFKRSNLEKLKANLNSLYDRLPDDY